MTLQELMNKRAKAWEAAKAFLDSHRNTDGLLSQHNEHHYFDIWFQQVIRRNDHVSGDFAPAQ